MYYIAKAFFGEYALESYLCRIEIRLQANQIRAIMELESYLCRIEIHLDYAMNVEAIIRIVLM